MFSVTVRNRSGRNLKLHEADPRIRILPWRGAPMKMRNKQGKARRRPNEMRTWPGIMKKRARQLLLGASQADYVLAQQQDQRPAKMAYLARALRNDPENIAAVNAISQLLFQSDLFPRHTRWIYSVHAFGSSVGLFSPDRSKVAIYSPFGKSVFIWEVDEFPKQIAQLEFTEDVRGVTFSPDGQFIVTTDADHFARIWRTSNGTTLATLLANV
jgi:hypothetical protein